MPSDASPGHAHARRQPLTEDEKRRVLRERSLALKPSVNPDKLAAAEAAPTLLARELILRNLTPRTAAARVGIDGDRLRKIAAGEVKPYGFEAEKLAKTFGESVDILISPNDAASRAKQRPLI